MLKLKRIELFGFKSFSDKADIAVIESGVTDTLDYSNAKDEFIKEILSG